MSKNKVSIIIPVFNEKNYIKKIIKKINKNIYFNKQIIVVDDFSYDGTKRYFKKIKNVNKIVFILKIKVKVLQLNLLCHL